MIAEPGTIAITALVEEARHEGVFFPRDPATPDGVQIRCHRDATEEGMRHAAVLRERRDEVDHFFKERRPAWPAIPDDPYGPRLDPDEPDGTIVLIKLEEILAEDRIAEFIEQEVAYVQERIAGVVARAVAAHRTTAVEPKRPQPTPIRRRKPETADRVVFE